MESEPGKKSVDFGEVLDDAWTRPEAALSVMVMPTLFVCTLVVFAAAMTVAWPFMTAYGLFCLAAHGVRRVWRLLCAPPADGSTPL